MKKKYYLAVISAFIIFGLMSLPLKALDRYQALDILLSRVSFSAVLMLLFSIIFRRKISFQSFQLFSNLGKQIKIRLLTINIVSAVALAVNWYLFIYVMNNISVNANALAYMICPIITTVLACVFLKEKLVKLQWLAVFLSLFSCILLASGNYIDFLYSFGVGLSYALYLVLQKNNNQLDRFFTLTFQIMIAAILLLPFYTTTSPFPLKTTYYFSLIFIIAAGFTILPMYLNVYALNRLSSSTAGIFIYLNPIVGFLLALFYFHEVMSSLKIIAYALVFFSVVLFNLETIIKHLQK